MLAFQLILWALDKAIRVAIRVNPKCAAFVQDKNLVFQIQTQSGEGRYYTFRHGKFSSNAGLSNKAQFVLTFKDAIIGVKTLSAKDSTGAFLQALQCQDLTVTGDFTEVMWFQSLTDYIKPNFNQKL